MINQTDPNRNPRLSYGDIATERMPVEPEIVIDLATAVRHIERLLQERYYVGSDGPVIGDATMFLRRYFAGEFERFIARATGRLDGSR